MVDSVDSSQRPDIVNARGFSLIELMVVIAILAILLGIGVPNLQAFAVNSRLGAASNEFYTALNLARSEALRRGAQISVRHLGTAGSRDWSSGWSMFVDLDRDGVLDVGEEEVRRGPPQTAPLTNFATANFATFIAFDAQGRLTSGGGTFVVCHGANLVEDGQARSRAIVVNASGRARFGVDANNDRIPETDTAAVASCNNP